MCRKIPHRANSADMVAGAGAALKRSRAHSAVCFLFACKFTGGTSNYGTLPSGWVAAKKSPKHSTASGKASRQARAESRSYPQWQRSRWGEKDAEREEGRDGMDNVSDSFKRRRSSEDGRGARACARVPAKI